MFLSQERHLHHNLAATTKLQLQNVGQQQYPVTPIQSHTQYAAAFFTSKADKHAHNKNGTSPIHTTTPFTQHSTDHRRSRSTPENVNGLVISAIWLFKQTDNLKTSCHFLYRFTSVGLQIRQLQSKHLVSFLKPSTPNTLSTTLKQEQ